MDALAYLKSFKNGTEQPAWIWIVIHKVEILIPEGIILNELEKLQIEAVLTNKDGGTVHVELTTTALIAFIRSCRK